MAISTIGQNGLNAPLSLTTPNLGTPSALVLTNATGLPTTALPSGTIKQVVTAKATGTTTSASTSAVSLGISVSITVRAGSSVVALAVSGIYGSGNGGSWSSTGRIWLYRDSTVLSTSEHMGVITSLEQTSTHSIMYLDQSLSAGTYTYAVKGSSTTGGTLNYNRDAYMGNLILMEVAG